MEAGGLGSTLYDGGAGRDPQGLDDEGVGQGGGLPTLRKRAMERYQKPLPGASLPFWGSNRAKQLQQLFRSGSRRGRILAGHQLAVDLHVGDPVGGLGVDAAPFL